MKSASIKQQLFTNEMKKLKHEIQRHKKIISSKELEMYRLKKELESLHGKTAESGTDKRSSRRTEVFLAGEITVGSKKILALIDNISEKGIHMKVSPLGGSLNIPVGKVYGLKFKLPSGEILNHSFSVKWSYKALPHRVVTCMGSEIIEPPQKYKKFMELFSHTGLNHNSATGKDKQNEKIFRQDPGQPGS
jgi:hypothetical protein